MVIEFLERLVFLRTINLVFQIISFTHFETSTFEFNNIFDALFRNSFPMLLFKCSVFFFFVTMIILICIFAPILCKICGVPIIVMVFSAVIVKYIDILMTFVYANDEIAFKPLLSPSMFCYSSIMNFGTLAICNGLVIVGRCGVLWKLFMCIFACAYVIFECMLFRCGYNLNTSYDFKPLQAKISCNQRTLWSQAIIILTIGVLPVLISYTISNIASRIMEFDRNTNLDDLTLAIYVTLVSIIFMLQSFQ